MKVGKKSPHIYLLFALVILLWAVAWPAAKYALGHISPAWLFLTRNSLAAISMFIIAACSGNLVIPDRRDWLIILFMGSIQVFAFSSLCTYGLQYADAGHSAILVYTTPIWVAPIAFLFFKEKLYKMKLLGLLLGTIGIIFLLNPTQISWTNHEVLIGNLILLAAAIIWASTILAARYMKWHRTPMQIAPWQFLVSTTLALILCLTTDPVFHFDWDPQAVAAILFLGILGTAVAIVCSTTISRQLPATTTALGLLGVPLFGVLASYWLLDESLNQEKIWAMIFIFVGLICSILSDRLNRV